MRNPAVLIGFFSLLSLIQIIIIAFLIGKVSSGKKAMDKLTKSESKYRTVFRSMQEGFALYEIVFDQEGKPEEYYLIDTNPAFEEITGYKREKVMYQSIFDLFPLVGMDSIENINTVALTGEAVKFECYSEDLNKYLSGNIFKSDQDKLAFAFSDITNRKRAENLLKKQSLSFEALFKNSSDAIVLFDRNHKVVDINEKFSILFGYSINEIRGREVDSIIASAENLDEANQLTRDLFQGHEVSMESVRFGADGLPREVSIKGLPIILNNEIIGGYGIYTDISERKKAEKEILYMSYHDQLTGVYNRRFFEEELKRLDTRRNLPISVIMADVNGLKLINDAFGHYMGDKLLVETAELMKRECRADEIIARLGGDEFVILLPKTKAEETESIVKRIKLSGSKIRLQSMELSISFGWDTKKDAAQDINEVLKNAEDYMYRHKLFESPSIRGKTMHAIINSLYEKNKREEQHSQRVSYLCGEIGAAMNLSESEVNLLKTAGLLHDIGKIAIDDNILNKPDRLTGEEWSEIMRHPEIGYRILSSANEMAELAEYVLAHHERWDGKGYPKGLMGEEIPLQARIIMIADAYDAMTSERSYRKPMPKKLAARELVKNAGAQFDPDIVNILVKEVLSITNVH